MKKIITYLSIFAASILAVTACQREDLEPSKDNPAVTHTVNFIAGGPEAKTSYGIDTDNETVTYLWSDTDANTSEQSSKFTVYENGEEADSVVATLNETDKLMYISATFSGTAPTSPNYQAVFNSGVSSTQTSSGTTYDQNSDVLVSEPLTSTDGKDMKFSFKREVAMAKMTLTGLPSGNKIKRVTIATSGAPIAGTYVLGSGFTDTVNEMSVETTNTIGADGITLNLVTIPFDSQYLTITAETYVDGSPNTLVTYMKTFTNPISFTRGNVMDFKVSLANCGVNTLFYESFDSNTGTGGNDGKWSGTIASGSAYFDNTWDQQDDVVYGANHCIRLGKTNTSGYIRKSTSSPILLNGKSTIKFRGGSWKGDNSSLNVLIQQYNGSTTSTVQEKSFDLKNAEFIDNTWYVNITGNILIKFIADPPRAFLDEVRIYKGLPSNLYTINCAATDNGVISTSKDVSAVGETITLIATPEEGYGLYQWIVTDQNSNQIEVNNNTFVMPESDINVSAVFKNKFSGTYLYGLSNWTLTNYTDKKSYYLVPIDSGPSIATISGIFSNKSNISNVVVTLKVATFGSGTNPSESTFTIYNSNDLTTPLKATQGGTLPTSLTYTEVTYTIADDAVSSLTSGIAIHITKPGKQIRLKSIGVDFLYQPSSQE